MIVGLLLNASSNKKVFLYDLRKQRFVTIILSMIYYNNQLAHAYILG